MSNIRQVVKWLAALAITGGLAWFGWSMGPVPRFVVQGLEKSCSVCFSADARWLASSRGRLGRGARIWDAATGQLVLDRPDVSIPVGFNHAPYDPPSYWRDLVFGDEAAREVGSLDASSALQSFAKLPDGADYWDSNADGDVVFLESPTAAQSKLLSRGAVSDFNVPSEHFVWFTRQKGVLHCSTIPGGKSLLWDAGRGATIPGALPVACLFQSPNGRFFAAWATDGDKLRLQVYDLSLSRTTIAPLAEADADSSRDVAISNDGRLIALGANERAAGVTLFDVSRPGWTESIKVPPARAATLAFRNRFSDDGRRLFTAFGEYDMASWDVSGEAPRLRGVVGPTKVMGEGVQVVQVFAEAVDEMFDGRRPPYTTSSFLESRKLAAGWVHNGWYDTRSSFLSSPDGRRILMEAPYYHITSQARRWFEKNLPAVVGRRERDTSEAVLIDVDRFRPVAHWNDVMPQGEVLPFHSCHIAPDSSAMALWHADGRIGVYDLPPARRVLLPSVMTLPLLGLTWLFWRRRRRRA